MNPKRNDADRAADQEAASSVAWPSRQTLQSLVREKGDSERLRLIILLSTRHVCGAF